MRELAPTLRVTDRCRGRSGSQRVSAARYSVIASLCRCFRGIVSASDGVVACAMAMTEAFRGGEKASKTLLA